MKKAILVLGPPRSGTSVLSHILNKLGVDFGDHDRFVDPVIHPWNPIFFELQSLNNLNDDIFAHFSKAYPNFDWLPSEDDFNVPLMEKFEKKIISFVQDEFGSANVIGLKDPRFCFTLPIWDVILKRHGFNISYVLTRRLSSAVFSSNIKENKLSSEINFRLVAQSVLLARRFVEGKFYLTVNYEDLISNPQPTILRLCENLNLENNLIDEACAVIRRELCHQLGKLPQSTYSFFDSVIDAKFISPEEYLLYREIFLAARVTHEVRSVNPTEFDTYGFDTQISIKRDQLQMQLADKNAYIVKIEKELAEYAAHKLQVNNELLRAEAQLDFLKEFFVSDNARSGF